VSIVVHGSGFTAGRGVELSFIEGAASVKADVVADGERRFQHVVDEVVPRDAGCPVIAREEDGGVALARLQSFVPSSLRPEG
jgi:hypothetical protein